MRITKCFLLVFLFGFSRLAISQQPGNTKFALLIGIGSYPEEKGWPQLSSIRDVDLIRNALLRQGYKDSNIEVLKDSQATKNNILDQIKELTSRVNKNDIVLIHFSTHGEQVEDLNGDESDGLDEAVVPYNAVAPNRSTNFLKDVDGYLIDDDLGLVLQVLRAKLGKLGDLVVFMDLCHSGTGTRGIAKVRGDQPPLVSKSFHFNKQNKAILYSEDFSKNNNDGLSSFTVISAAKANELDYEAIDDSGIEMGSLSYAIIKALEQLDPQTTYRSLFSKIQAVMNVKAQNQHPVIEGTNLNREIFGGNYISQQPYAEIQKISGKQIFIKSGTLTGFSSGSLVGVYPSGTPDYHGLLPLAKGRVVHSDYFGAEIALDSLVDINPSEAWVFNMIPKYSLAPIGLKLVSSKSNGFSVDDEKEIKKIASDVAIKFNGQPELLLVKGKTNDTLKLASTGAVFSLTTNESLKDQLTRYCRLKFLKAVEVRQNDLNVSVKLARLRKGILDTLSNVKVTGYEFYEGDSLKVVVKNTSKQAIFINILDIQPDGQINAVFPKREESIFPEDLMVGAGTERVFPAILTVSPPFGTEVFKIFISSETLDVEDIAEQRGVETRGNLSFLEYLVKESYLLSRGVQVDNNTEKNGTVSSIVFQVRPRPLKN